MGGRRRRLIQLGEQTVPRGRYLHTKGGEEANRGCTCNCRSEEEKGGEEAIEVVREKGEMRAGDPAGTDEAVVGGMKVWSPV